MAKAGRTTGAGGNHLTGDKVRGHSTFTPDAYLVGKAAIEHPLIQSISPGVITHAGGAKQSKVCFVASQNGVRGWEVKVVSRQSVQIMRIVLKGSPQLSTDEQQEEENKVKQYLEAALAQDKKTLRRLLRETEETLIVV
jgi:hypothetical protein